MKTLSLIRFAFAMLFLITNPMTGIGQEESKLSKIDSMVANINSSKLLEEKDSVRNDIPAYDVFILTIIAAHSQDLYLKKLVYRVLIFEDAQKNTIAEEYSMTFYYNSNELIKVEEKGNGKGVMGRFSWYFEGNKVIKIIINPQPPEVTDEGSAAMKRHEAMLRLLSSQLLSDYRSKHDEKHT